MLNYRGALKRLFDSGPQPKLGLERMQILMADLGHPQNSYPVFHVAGTNGKGSTCAFLESILRAAGYKTGLYTSPHLSCARERIQINRECILEAEFVRLENQIALEATFFERMTAMALLHFAQQKVDVAIVEVGLGGRLDATNIVRPVVCGISRIDLDHQLILGDTLQKIAVEKAGIMKPGVPVCWSPQEAVVEKILKERATLLSVSAISAESLAHRFDELGLAGPHQIHNASLAVNMILAAGISVSNEAIQNGLSNAHWPCRYEFVGENILLDGAHNPAGTQALISAIQQDARFQNKNLALSVGLTEGHGAEDIVRLWAHFAPGASVYMGQSKSLRALPKAMLRQYFQEQDFVLCDIPSFSKEEILVVTGSLYWAGQIRSELLSMPVDPIFTAY